MTVDGLQARRVSMDFDGVRTDWNHRDPEFGELLNAMSTQLPFLEPFLIRSLKAVQSQVPTLQRDIDLFCFQEARHHTNHARFNAIVRASHPVAVAAGETRCTEVYTRLAAKGPRFALSYAAGFETVAPLVSTYFFQHTEALGLDPELPTAYLWLWHFAEEYEHRAVCHDVYQEVYGDHLYRLYGIWYATIHLFGYALRLSSQTLRVRRSAMSRLGRLRSRLHLTRVLVAMAVWSLPRLVVGGMRRGYDPDALPEPAGLSELLRSASDRFGTATYVGRP